MIWYRHADLRMPFLVESAAQPPARWHDVGEGPVQYLSDTPDGAWAEFLCHEEITEAEDLETVRRAMWAVDVPDEDYPEPNLPPEVLTGGPETYPACREEARRVLRHGAPGIVAASAGLLPGGRGGGGSTGGSRRGPTATTAPSSCLDGARTSSAGPRWPRGGRGTTCFGRSAT